MRLVFPNRRGKGRHEGSLSDVPVPVRPRLTLGCSPCHSHSRKRRLTQHGVTPTAAANTGGAGATGSSDYVPGTAM